MRNGSEVVSEKIVVGKRNTPTPIFSADMQFIIFHPSWGVPPGMKANELWPQLRNTGGGWFSSSPSASSVLRSHGLIVSYNGRPIDPDQVSWGSVDIRQFDFVQPPGPRNVLGIVKFRFPNKHDVYMHDTPERHLFGGSVRAFSHGCMRVQNAVKLAEVLLEHDKGWSRHQVQEYVRRGGEIKLSGPIPVHITYFTAVADEAGKVQYHGDIYGLDSRMASALERQPVRLVTPASQRGAETKAQATAPRRAAGKRRARKPLEPFNSSNPFTALFGD
jgi:murein L,D-transpeptidase YcbB/YkuD